MIGGKFCKMQRTSSCEDARKEQPAEVEGHPCEDGPQRPHRQANACTHCHNLDMHIWHNPGDGLAYSLQYRRAK